jgi:hypothetical protein
VPYVRRRARPAQPSRGFAFRPSELEPEPDDGSASGADAGWDDEPPLLGCPAEEPDGVSLRERPRV